jgi:nucleoporin POM152
MRSSFPTTPQQNASSTPAARTTSSLPTLPNAPTAAASTTSPVIPENLLDAPSQRMYTFAVYGLLLVWRLYDWWRLVEDDTTSLWLFFKWSIIDLFFMFGVPMLRIPWLEWSDATSFTASFVHTILNGILMFRVPVSASR